MRQARIPLALVAAALPLLTGCTDGGAQADPEPIIPSSSSAQPSPDEPTESATEEPPEMPAAASERSYAGAEAFVRHWVELFNHTQLTGDTEPMMAASDAACVSCRDAKRVADDIYGPGGSLESQGWVVRQVGSDGISPLDAPLLSSSIRQTAEKVTYKDPDRVVRNPANTFTVLFRLERASGSWLMREVEVR